MLPIVKRKTLEVPHGLAALAAAVCLVLAFATDFSEREEHLRADIDATPATELSAAHAANLHDSGGSAAEATRKPGNDARPTGSSTSSASPGGLLSFFGLPR
ncbi:hypothetical protein [Wenzhouxiangella marina]|uniref:Uncharacterized protein n=1 Tax=Wenzhouxiangella marina TaxID=1579979 RepID=A0A0K0XX95_9GAMM|nr:hypothetical protein [Wenzhouxiangella marina]AKS42319.1 hypothetical protein WM2015_1953 [Wenzhouxiangella marina]MBB6085908.1 hypothetical protein [Wenzhouxiangella marina]